jgi:hypothetical protein
MKKEASPSLPEKKGPYPKSRLMVLIAFAVSIYILWPFPDEAFFKLIKHQWFLHSFSVIFTIAVAQVWLVFLISDLLDDKYSWEKRFYHRVLGQLFIGWIVPVAVSALINWFWFQYLQADIHSIRYAYNRYMFKAIMDIALILNLIYLACSIGWYLKERLKEEVIQQEKPLFANHLYLSVSDSKEETKFPVSEIAYFYLTEKGTLLRAHDGSSFIFWESLDKLEKQLDPDHFYRARRPCIINREAVKSWRKQADRKVSLTVLPQPHQPVFVSKEKAADFIAWVKKDVPAMNDPSMN